MLKSFVYKLYPTITQIKSLEEMRETCRRWYNNCLAERKTAYEEEKKTVSKVEQLRHVKDYRVSNEYAAKVHSHVLQNVMADLDKSFKAFFGRVKAGETPGYPRFKGRNRFRSFGFKEYGNGFKIDGRRLKLFGIGRVAVRWHRPIEGIIKTVRIIKKAGDWYACFSCLIEIESLPREFTYVGEPANVTRSPTGDAIGVDVGVSSLISTSTGEKVDNPQYGSVKL
jgi:putative transposase